MTRTIPLLVFAFIAGTITTGTLAFAAPPPDNPGNPFEEISEKVDQILAIVFDLDTNVDMVKTDVGMIKTTVNDLDTNVDMVKTDVGMIKTTVNDIDTNVDMVKTDVGMIKDDVGDIEEAVDTLVNSGLVRILTQIDDGDDKQYEGTITYDRTGGSGIFLIEKLYLCDVDIGQNTGDDELEIDIQIENQRLEDPEDNAIAPLNRYKSGPFTQDAGCVDLLYSTALGDRIGSLPGSENRVVKLFFEETDVDNFDADDDGGQIIAYISGIADSSEMTVTSTLDNN